MTILAELAALYDRSPDMPRPGYSREAIGGEIVLDPDGQVVEMNSLMAADDTGRMRPRSLSVPSAVKRTAGIKPNLIWDKSAYVLGVVAALDGDGKLLVNESGDPEPGQTRRTAEEHAAFVSAHQKLLQGAVDAGLTALLHFLDRWTWDMFAKGGYPARLIDQNLVFRLAGENSFLHDKPEVAAMFEMRSSGGEICLVTGNAAPVARLHPTIKGVAGAQSSGASLVSFNEPAYESHGKKQGDNAPVSEAAASAYGTALNTLLARGSGRNLRIGDTTVVFWADAATPNQRFSASDLLKNTLSPEDVNTATIKLRDQVTAIANGRWKDAPDYDPDTRIFILGLAPNAARLSVRFWHCGGLQDFADRIAAFWDGLQITPSPWIGRDGVERPPAAWQLPYEVAALGEAKNIPPLLGGALMRAVLTGADFPRTLLSGVIGRLRVEGSPRDRFSDGRRAAIIRAVLTRNTAREVPMALDETNDDIAYVLGRLFAAYAYAESSYARRGATIRDKYLGSASANPARIFPVLMRGYEHNRAALAKTNDQRVGAGRRAEQAVEAIIAKMAGHGNLPTTLSLEDQGRFFVGFYHQWSSFFQKAEDVGTDDENDTEQEPN